MNSINYGIIKNLRDCMSSLLILYIFEEKIFKSDAISYFLIIPYIFDGIDSVLSCIWIMPYLKTIRNKSISKSSVSVAHS